MQRRIATTAGRHGFTMIELMIVIAVIGLLMTLVTVGAMRFLGTAKEAATKATLTKIHRQLQSRIQAIERMDLEEFFRLTNQDSTYSQALNDAGFTTIMGTASSSPRAALIGKVILKKSVFKLYLPQTWAEANYYILSKSGQSLPSSYAAGYSATVPEPEHSAELLYLLLTDASLPGYSPAESDVFTAAELKDTNNNGKVELVDGWGRPFRFFRWPTRLLRSDGLTALDGITGQNFLNTQLLVHGVPTSVKLPFAQNKNHDPDDAANVVAATAVDGTGALSATTFEDTYHTAFTWHSPLVMSAGADGLFGIFAENDQYGRLCQVDPNALSALEDNITNLNLTAGGN